MRWKSRDGGDPREFGAMNLDTHLNDKVLKDKYIETMFDLLAPGYNLFTRIFSFGMDRRWKAQLIEEIRQPRLLAATARFGLRAGQRDRPLRLLLAALAVREAGGSAHEEERSHSDHDDHREQDQEAEHREHDPEV